MNNVVTAQAPSQVPSQAPARRVISLVPAVTEMLFAMGAGDVVVGVSSYDTFPPEAATRPKVGALVDPDFERILTLRPDLVVVYGSQEELMRRLERASIPYYRYRHAGLSDVTSTMRELGARVGRTVEANRGADRIEADLAAVRASVAGRPRPRTAVLFGREPGALRGIYASGGYGFLHDLLELAGGQNVFADVKRENLQATSEVLLSRAPEVILEIRASAGWTPARATAERAVWAGLPSLPAVRTNRIHFLTDEALSIPGPRVAAVAKMLAGVIHGQ
jgi:iron complex transport system substrate-binding protein